LSKKGDMKMKKIIILALITLFALPFSLAYGEVPEGYEEFIHVIAYIDGSDYFEMTGTQWRWEHVNWRFPGDGDGGWYNTYVNSQPFRADWGGYGRGEHGVYSSWNEATEISPIQEVFGDDVTIHLEAIQARLPIYLHEVPNSENGYTFIVFLNDDGRTSGDFYEFKIWAYGTRPVQVINRQIFYNNSIYDAFYEEPNALDSDAIATDKVALLSWQVATYANYTNYDKGINGIMIDIENLPEDSSITVDDFEFKVGNEDRVANWQDAPLPSYVTVSEIDNDHRITLIWPDNAISGEWLQTRLLASDNTGLEQDDVFYFGNAIGECGNSDIDAKVNAIDMLCARDNQRDFLDPADITFPYDFNRDTRVNATDMLVARNNVSNYFDALRLITPEE